MEVAKHLEHLASVNHANLQSVARGLEAKLNTIEQTFRIANPNWTTSETRAGDGLHIQFTRPFSANAGVFFRVRVE